MKDVKNILADAKQVDRNSPLQGIDAFCQSHGLDVDRMYYAVSLVERCPPADHGPSPALVVVEGESMTLDQAHESIGCSELEAVVAKEIAHA